MNRMNWRDFWKVGDEFIEAEKEKDDEEPSFYATSKGKGTHYWNGTEIVKKEERKTDERNRNK